ncbi:DNA-binding protein [Mycobacterium sp. 852002-51759_SCH5129042]|nr:DNA-binding protein [Mycobacterium sp. 852002-51759_SCH5129042]
MAIIEFAGHLGVSEGIVNKWERKGRDITPRPVNQAALDTSLSRLTAEELARFLAGVPADAIGDAPYLDELIQPDRIRHPIDGRSMTWIPSGPFLSGPMDENVWLPGYHIDTYPVTNTDYAAFVTATGHPAPRHWTAGQPPRDIADHPVVWVTHDDAAAYAHWAHKQLPTAQQWEKAARGTDGAKWPWGSEITPAKCNCKVAGKQGATTPVDRYKSSVSPYGVYDMCGNVWEWCATEWAGRFELKGAAFTSLLEDAAPAAFNDADRTMCDNDTGFRCVTTTLKP